MSHIRQLPRPITTMRGEPDKVIVNIDFRKGLDYGAAYDMIEPGYAFYTGNMMPESRGITPRSGLTSFGQKSFDTMLGIRGGWNAKDKDGVDYAYFVSSWNPDTFYRGMWFVSGKEPKWQNPQGGLNDWQMVSTNSYAFYDFTYIYDPGRANNIGVVTNDEDNIFFFTVGQNGATAVSDFTDTVLVRKAATVCAADDRLVFANVKGSDGRQANRVAWTVRGNPRNFTLAQGAGFQDINEARGPFTKIIAEGEGFLLFTDSEIWRATPRRDRYAFDFAIITPDLGLLNPRTVVTTPFGVVFVGTDSEIYTIAGNQLRNLSWKDDHSRVSFLLSRTEEPRRMHAVYDKLKKQYILFYVSSSIYPYGEDDPGRAFVYDFSTDSLWWWFMPEEISAAAQLYQTSEIDEGDSTWNEQVGTWDAQVDTWDNRGLNAVNKTKIVIMAGGQPMTLSDDALCDSRASLVQTQEIYTEWSSHGHTVPGLLHYYSRLEQAWIEYNYFPGPGAVLPAHSTFTVGGGQREMPVKMTNTECSGLSYAHIPIDDTNRAPIMDFYFSQNSYTSRPVWVRAQTIVSNAGEFLG